MGAKLAPAEHVVGAGGQLELGQKLRRTAGFGVGLLQRAAERLEAFRRLVVGVADLAVAGGRELKYSQFTKVFANTRILALSLVQNRIFGPVLKFLLTVLLRE